ncbi:MAG: immunity 63 family protein [Intrasporangium sp.]|uniref:Imm63 family immunity protein n=1 Tax=Intrasporangium sp. TaxID=1925024 RepID=UPI0026470EFA|nr:Imm63 family immunity protein [Intrasporangium sp.]MDN5795103.1 immunity 63 family protein [Intrasporangium sp.]
MTTSAEIAATLTRLAARVHIPVAALPDFRPNGEARPFLVLEVDGTLHWRVDEAGRTLSDLATHDLDELLYWALRGVTFTAAADWEPAHRVPGQDSRRLRWAHQHELLARLDPRWAGRWRTELADELRAAGATADLALLPPERVGD